MPKGEKMSTACSLPKCSVLFVSGEEKGNADDMIFQAGVWLPTVRSGEEKAEDAIARILSTPDRKYEIRYV